MRPCSGTRHELSGDLRDDESLTFLIQINDNVCDIVTMVTNLSVPSGFYADERGIVELGDEAEDLSLP